MGQTAPIGSLVLARPASSYHVGEIVSFTEHGSVYTHRISGVTAGGFTTRGDLNATNDPWTLHSSDVIGEVVWHGAGWGWLLTALPWDVAGVVVILLVSRIGRLPHSWRWAIRITGCSLLFGLTVAVLRPWLGIELLGYTPASDGGVLMRVVNVGLFNVNAHGTVLASGQAAVIHLRHPSAGGHYLLTPTAALTVGQRISATIVALLPLTLAFVAAWRPQSRHSLVEARRRMPRLGFAALAVVLVAVAVVGQSLTLASLTASITNTDSAGTGVWNDCRIQEKGTSGVSQAWAMGTTSTTEADFSGNGSTGSYNITPTLSTTSVGCKFDTPHAAVTFNGSSQCLSSSNELWEPQPVSLEAWFQTTSKTPAAIISFGPFQNALGDADNAVYLDENGRVVVGSFGATFGSSPSGKSYADGNWHQVVVTLSSSGAVIIYIDGAKVGSGSNGSTGNYGYWMVGCGDILDWFDATGNFMTSASSYFAGQLQYAAVYTAVLTAAQVQAHYLAGIGS